MDVFARKIEVARQAQERDQFMVVARIESLITGTGQDDVVRRARRYADAGADALLVHSRASTVTEVALANTAIREGGVTPPVFAIPTSYYRTDCEELRSFGLAGAIFANQLLRAALSAMEEVLSVVVTAGSSAPAESRIAPLTHLFDVVGTDRLEDGRPLEPASGPSVSVTKSTGR